MANQKVRLVRELGRTMVTYYATNAAAGTTTTETAITLTRSAGVAATSTGASQTPTRAKTYAITFMQFQHVGNATATTAVTTWNVRVNTAGAVTTSSTPIIASCRTSTPATTGAVDRVQLFFDPPLEITADGTVQIGVTAAAAYTTNAPTWDVLIAGYEYGV